MVESKKNLEERKWYIICTKPRKEMVVYQEITHRGFEAKLIQKTATVTTQKGVRKVLKPLISGYVFIHILEKEIALNQYVVGISRFLKWNNKYEHLREEDIALLEKICDHDYEVAICDKLSVGTKIEITEGVLKGVQGIITSNIKGTQIHIESALQSMNIVLKKENLSYKIIE
jgi:transcription antitermination factor NusG